MLRWLLLLLVASSIIVFLLLIFCLCKFLSSEKPEERESDVSRNGLVRLQRSKSPQQHQHHQHHNPQHLHHHPRTNYYVLRRGASLKPLFNWADNPSLVTDAVENGWSRFAFATLASSPTVRSTRALLGACATGADGGRESADVDVSWEVCPGSADFMQKIRMNPGLKKIAAINSSPAAAATVIKSALPLPGPPLGNASSFPQEAYFEITVLSGHDYHAGEDADGKVKAAEGERMKLIKESPSEKSKSESLIHVTATAGHVTRGNGTIEGLGIGSRKEQGKGDAVAVSMGLAVGGSPTLKIPGSYVGSIGFNSDGSVLLDGRKLGTESKIWDWGIPNKVIGCGYNPSLKKVFFTLDSQLVHEIHCKSEEFGTPLYPTLAANVDVTVLVNLGQSAFRYAPANLQRTSNPCFIGPLANSPTLGYEDSKELFSMGRIDSQWLHRSATRSTQYNGSSYKGGPDFDEVSEGDLFEIVLDNFGRSPNISL